MAVERHEERLGKMLYAHLRREWRCTDFDCPLDGYDMEPIEVQKAFQQAAVSFLAHAREDHAEEKTQTQEA